MMKHRALFFAGLCDTSCCSDVSFEDEHSAGLPFGSYNPTSAPLLSINNASVEGKGQSFVAYKGKLRVTIKANHGMLTVRGKSNIYSKLFFAVKLISFKR